LHQARTFNGNLMKIMKKSKSITSLTPNDLSMLSPGLPY
jgi:hypothetical protein